MAEIIVRLASRSGTGPEQIGAGCGACGTGQEFLCWGRSGLAQCLLICQGFKISSAI